MGAHTGTFCVGEGLPSSRPLRRTHGARDLRRGTDLHQGEPACQETGL